jgi:hypothetical protein
MPRGQYRLPDVFVGCPYKRFDKFTETLERIPFRFQYAKQGKEQFLLESLRTGIREADFCIFDISTWNPNVAHEIGLAEGLGVKYFILRNTKLRPLPSNLQGLHRQLVEYRSYDDLDQKNGLWPKLVGRLVSKQTRPENIWEALKSDPLRTKKYYLALRILAHFKYDDRLRDKRLEEFARDAKLRKPDKEKLLRLLGKLRFLSNIDRSKGATLQQRLVSVNWVPPENTA